MLCPALPSPPAGTLRAPTRDDTARIGRCYGLGLSEPDLASFAALASSLLASYDEVERLYAASLPEPPDRPWQRPAAEQNELGLPGTACAPGAPVILCTVTGGGHTWPGGEQYLPLAIIGAASRQSDATQVIWRFFSALR